MATYTVYITESKNYQTEVEAASYEAALSAAIATDTTTLTASVDKSVSARLA
jgi:hypothetical protein